MSHLISTKILQPTARQRNCSKILQSTVHCSSWGKSYPASFACRLAVRPNESRACAEALFCSKSLMNLQALSRLVVSDKAVSIGRFLREKWCENGVLLAPSVDVGHVQLNINNINIPNKKYQKKTEKLAWGHSIQVAIFQIFHLPRTNTYKT